MPGFDQASRAQQTALVTAIATVLSCGGYCATAGAQSLTLEEITVTARKREESLQDLPITVSAVTSADIERQGLTDITQVAQFTPGFSMQNVGGTTEQPFIRGMSVTSFSSSLQTTSSYHDGVYASLLGRTMFFDDIERLEVIKGPQSAMFGRATFAGAINYVTKKPTATSEGYVRLLGGEDGKFEGHASYSGPLAGEELLFRISYNNQQYGGEYRNNNGGGKMGIIDRQGVTAALLWQPNDQFEANLRVLATWFDDRGQQPQYIQPASTNNCFPNSSGLNIYYCGKVIVDEALLGLNFDLTDGSFYDFEQQRYVLDLRYDFGPVSLTSTTAYADQSSRTFCDCDYSPLVSFGGAFHSLFDTQIDNLSQELRIESRDDGPLTWLAGMYWFNEEGVTGRVNTPTPPILPDTEVTTKAIYGSVTYAFTERFTLSVDARYQEENQTYTGSPTNPDLDVDYDSFLPRIIAEFRPSAEAMVYASISKGSKPGTFNTGANVPQEFIKVDEEELWNYEIGAKTSWMEGRLRANVAAFYVDWTDQAYATQVIGNNGALVNIQDNLGGSRIQGLEFDMTALVGEHLTLRGAGAWIDAEYVDFLSGNALRVYGDAQVKGRQLPNQPRLELIVGASYSRPLALANGYDWFVNGDYQWRESQYLAEINQAETGDLNLVNLRAGVDNGRLKLQLAVDNALDDDTPVYATRFSDLNTFPFQFGYLINLRPGRAVSLSASYRF